MEISAKRKLVGVTEFAKMVCSGTGHIQRAPSKSCKDCGAKMGRSKSTVGFMAKVGRIPGTVKPGNEWLIDLSVVIARQKEIRWRARGRPVGARKGGAK